MAPPKKKTKRIKKLAHIPEDVVLFKILPLLPLKALTKFKLVCKKWRNFISKDRTFSQQSSSAASGIVFDNCHKRPLFFVPTPAIGVSDPLLTFVPKIIPKVVRASANGLLCIECEMPRFRKKCLYICNPATKKGHRLRTKSRYKIDMSLVGMAFDPLNSPDRYKLVCPIVRRRRYGFAVFSSETAQWVKSEHHDLFISKYKYVFRPEKNVFAKGVLYWKNGNFLLCYNLEEDSAFTRELPFKRKRSVVDIGECRGRVTLTRTRLRSLDVWLMGTDGVGWEKYHRISLNRLVRLKLVTSVSCENLSKEIILLRCFDGRKLYLVRKGTNPESVYCYDMDTRKVDELCSHGRFVIGDVFPYANTMVKVPVLYPRAKTLKTSL